MTLPTAAKLPSYLVRAVDALQSLGLQVREPNSAPIAALIRSLAEVDEGRAVVVARTLAQQEVFDTVVAEQVASVTVGERYEAITKGFDSIRRDAKRMVDQFEGDGPSLGDRIGNVVMKLTRGDIADRFDAIRKLNAEVVGDVREQVEREQVILDAYAEFRGALKEAEVISYEILEAVDARAVAARSGVKTAAAAVEAFTGSNADRARLELAREEALRAYRTEDERYQVAKDLAENLRVSYNVTEVTMARLLQAHSAKERIWKQSVTFFATNTTVLSALKATFTGLVGLNEATRALDEMREGVSKSLETVAEIGGKVQEAALRSGYGPSIRADAVRKLVDSVVEYQEASAGIIAEMRERSTRNADEIRASVEEGKRRVAALASRPVPAALPAPARA